jgi:methionine sulfoxide reductase heme-binding subunit
MFDFRKFPWRERNGRFSPLKAAVFGALFLPVPVAVYDLMSGAFMADPVKSLIHVAGLWTIRLVLIALAVTPAMQIFKYPRLIVVRRMLGVGAFCYVAAHFTLFIIWKNFNLATVASEIVLRIYLTIGFCTLLILAALAATSTDAMVRRLGFKRWTLLHRFVYLAGVLGLIHYFMQSKLVVFEPTVAAGIFLWLMAYRALAWTKGSRFAAQPLVLFPLAAATGALTMAGEALGYTLLTPIDGARVFDANFMLSAGVRPGWYALGFGLAVALAALVRKRLAPMPQRVRAAA